ncbi:15-cis-phytoene synthase CrtB [Siccibacter colletis]|uniref:15-cis-phytoene synthase CrtB n=1 Tax=Siccibacter colletis TaxID=1505757 RepID=UPI003CF82BEA
MSQPLLDHASATMSAGSKSFATASKLFDKTTRRSALMLYTWCRYCDDVIDGQVAGFNVQQQVADSPDARLQRLRDMTRRAYEGEPMSEPPFAAFQEVALAHDIPPCQAFDHLEGYAMDVRNERYFTLDDTLRYCYHVAGVVGLMMARVMGVRDEETLDRACDLGLAFQLTNIARDIVEDAQVGRCYLPQQWLAEVGLNEQTASVKANRPALARIAARLVSEAEPYYQSAQAGLGELPLRSAWAIATAHGVYREIGVKVLMAGEKAWDQRQGTTRAEKISLVLAGVKQATASRKAEWPPRDPHLWQRPR